jgi:cation diffusion facilitator family transporter
VNTAAPQLERSREISAVLVRVLGLNLIVSLAKVLFGYASGSVAILSDGFHSLTDSASNVVALVGVRAAGKPPDEDHPYGHRKYETLASAGIFVFLAVVVLEVLRAAVARLGGAAPEVTAASFAVMGATAAVNIVVVRYETGAGRRLRSEVLLADARHTQSDLLTSLTVIAALIGARAGFPILDPIAALVVAVFIGRAGYEIARDASRILSDSIVIAEEDLRATVMSVTEVVGCHQIRTRGAADHVFVDLHVWLDPATRLDVAHGVSHVVKDRLMARHPQIADVIIHIEPPPL